MKKLSILCGLLLFSLSAFGQELYRNIAYADKNVRFTVISDGVIRMEYSPTGEFTDEESFVAVNRRYPFVDFSVRKGRTLEIVTSKFRMRYRLGSGAFSAENLSIRPNKKAPVQFEWRPGTKQTGNLKGTYRTLDGYNGSKKNGQEMPLEDGLLATDGWTFIDDSSNFLFDDSDWKWVKERKDKSAQDWYFMTYGHDYKQALKDFTLFSGRVPLPPRYAFGYWWSRYWAYSDKEYRTLLENFHKYDLPIDVLVVDMDWHYIDPQRGGWTGWTWNRSLFPNPQKFLAHLEEQGVEITLNLHPADGIRRCEEQYPAIAQDMNVSSQEGKDIAWTSSDKHFIQSVFKHILTPMEKDGVSFWWLDWQQFPTDRKIEGLSNTWWLNYTFFSHMEKYRNERPMLYHRWGGLGNHRYQIGFSGDAHITWESLDFQPYFNSTASNVLYGYWSHDIGGHMKGDFQPEMYIRWMQFGALSPIMRTHSSKDPDLRKEVWNFPHRQSEILRETIRLRYRLAPYIYTMARKTYDDALSLCRPMYYDYPEQEEAYRFKNQYMFGDQLLVAPITRPLEGKYVSQQVWLPEGEWFEWQTGTLLQGGQTIERRFSLDEYPIYVKAGSILPLYTDSVQNLKKNDEPVILTVFPGGDGEFSLYEDNGNDKDYATKYARTHITSHRTDNIFALNIAPRQGEYEGAPAHRRFSVKLLNAPAPLQVTLNGKPCTWSYSGRDFSVEVEIPETSCKVEKQLVVTFPQEEADFNGMTALSRRYAHELEVLKYKRSGIWDTFIDELAEMGSINEAAEYTPEKAAALTAQFKERYARLPQLLDRQGVDEESKAQMLEGIDWEFTSK